VNPPRHGPSCEEAPAGPPSAHARAACVGAVAAPDATDPGLLPVRMLNEYLYCPRLFYLMHVLGQWGESGDTEEGLYLHRRVDRPTRPLPTAEDLGDQDGRRFRSVTASSERLGLIAKMDVLDVEDGKVVPTDFKHGRPPEIAERAWPPERAQVCAQALILRDNGFTVDHGAIYYPTTNETVEVWPTDDLIAVVEDATRGARELEAASSPPPPLPGSRKCPRCSLVALCLPDETRLLADGIPEGQPRQGEVRPYSPPSDDALPLYLTTQGSTVGVEGHRLIIREPDAEPVEVRIKDVSHVSVFGFVQVSTQATRTLMSNGRAIGYFSTGGWFHGVAAPLGGTAAQLRRRQYARSLDERWSLALARCLVAAKIRNCRTLLRRNAGGIDESVLEDLRSAAERASRAPSAEVLLGIEGAAARLYFESFGLMLKWDPELAGFDFHGRNRRPPRDPVNAMLSLAYSILARAFTASVAIAGLDCSLGYYHEPRPGRPALALDLMEPFRPLLADSAVVTAINTAVMTPDDFDYGGTGCALRDAGRKRFIAAIERRLDQEVSHPVFGYRISYRRVIDVQCRLLARHLFDEIPTYPGFVTR
jgi:CRISP-associated protein Cas1